MEPFSRIFRDTNRIKENVGEIENQALANDGDELSPEGTQFTATPQLREVEKIRKEWGHISSGRRVLTWVLNSLFIMSLFVGLVLRISIPESNLDRVGDCLMMIGGLGILLVYFKQAGTFVFGSGSEPFRLGLNRNSAPLGFDEQGRSPFDRVRAND